MHESMNVFLVDEGCRAIEAKYDSDEKKIETFKTFDRSIAVGDLIVIPTSQRHGLAVFKVTAVDVAVDFDSTGEVRWIVDKIDTATYNINLKTERAMLDKINAANLLKRRRDLRDALIANAGTDVSFLPPQPQFT